MKTDTSNRKRRRTLNTNKDIVFEYFRLIKKKDSEQLLDLFAHDAVIYEPFSNLMEGLRGRSAIEPFLKVAVMANDRLQHHMIIEKKPYNETNKTNNNKDSDNVITALVTFEKGDSARARFTFELSSDDDNNDDDYNTDGISNSIHKKIKTLHIQFTK